MNRALSFGVVAVALAIIVAGCEGGSFLAPEPCNGNVEVTVLPVGQPVFAWSPDCGMSSVAVATVPSTPGAAGLWCGDLRCRKTARSGLESFTARPRRGRVCGHRLCRSRPERPTG